MQKASVFVKANIIGNYKDTNLVHDGNYYSHKKFYDTGLRWKYESQICFATFSKKHRIAEHYTNTG